MQNEDVQKIVEQLPRDLQESKARLEEAQRIAQVGHCYWNVIENRVIWSEELCRLKHFNLARGIRCDRALPPRASVLHRIGKVLH